MRKMLFTAAIASIAAISSASAQTKAVTSKEKPNIVKVNLFSAIVRTGNVSYERKIGANTSVQLGAFYTGFKADGTVLRGFGITPEFRYYASNSGAMQGFYLAPFARYQNFQLKDGLNKGTLNTFGGGLVIGNQWVYSKGITLDAFIGPSYNSGNVKVSDGTNSFNLPGGVDGFGVRAGITIGINF
ncbi:MAG: DUF3575 domain-containing protein [Chitinophagaceae bacterium]